MSLLNLPAAPPGLASPTSGPADPAPQRLVLQVRFLVEEIEKAID